MAQAAAVAGPVIGATGGVIGAIGARQEAKDRANALEYQAGLVDVETKNNIEDLEREKVAILGAQRASFGARGVKVSVGSPMSLEAETDRRAAIQKSRLKFAGESQAQLFRQQATMVRRAAKTQFTASLLQTAGSTTSALGKGGAFG